MRHLPSLLVLSLCTLPSYATEIYKCTNELGKVTYSQSPCSENADKIELKTQQPATPGSSSSNTSRDISNLSATADAQYRSRKRKWLKSDIDKLERTRDDKIKELRSQIVFGTENTEEGRAVAIKIQTLIDATKDHYDKQIKDKQREIDKL